MFQFENVARCQNASNKTSSSMGNTINDLPVIQNCDQSHGPMSAGRLSVALGYCNSQTWWCPCWANVLCSDKGRPPFQYTFYIFRKCHQTHQMRTPPMLNLMYRQWNPCMWTHMPDKRTHDFLTNVNWENWTRQCSPCKRDSSRHCTIVCTPNHHQSWCVEPVE